MKCILDVDRTLFDTKRFRIDSVPYQADGTWVTPQIWDYLDAKDYLYPDVEDFLETVGKDTVEILTAVTPELGPEAEAFQHAKLERSGLAQRVSRVTYMIGEKGPYLKDLTDNTPALFLDDRPEQLLSAITYAPHVVPVLMDRYNNQETIGAEHGFKMVQSMTEFKAVLTSL